MVSISGVRGVVGSTLTPECVLKFVSAFGALILEASKQPVIVLGRDSRVSGPWIEQIVEGVLVSLGFDVRSIGVVPTPTVQFMVQQLNASAGLVITSSHNPIEWNGLKFIDSDGLFLSPDRCAVLFERANQWPSARVPYCSWDGQGSIHRIGDAAERHVNAILALDLIDSAMIQKQEFIVCLDTVNGAGGQIMEILLKKLGCTVHGINLPMTGVFAHSPEPITPHLGDLCDAVKAHKAHLGIAVDPDVDRCVMIDEHGLPMGEEYTLAVAVDYALRIGGRRGVVCKNLSSSRAIDAIVEQYEGCRVVATPVGEIQVAKKMVELGAVIGGEGNGGVMLPDVHIGRDAPVAAALALQSLARFGKDSGSASIAALKASLPQWSISKHKTSVVGMNPEAVLEHFRAKWADKATVRTDDGVHISTEDWWVHLRK